MDRQDTKSPCTSASARRCTVRLPRHLQPTRATAPASSALAARARPETHAARGGWRGPCRPARRAGRCVTAAMADRSPKRCMPFNATDPKGLLLLSVTFRAHWAYGQDADGLSHLFAKRLLFFRWISPRSTACTGPSRVASLHLHIFTSQSLPRVGGHSHFLVDVDVSLGPEPAGPCAKRQSVCRPCHHTSRCSYLSKPTFQVAEVSISVRMILRADK